MRHLLIFSVIIVVAAASDVQDPVTQIVKADMAIKDAIFHKTTTPESTVPSPYVPADVIVTVPKATELPATAPPQTTGPAPPATTPAPATTPLTSTCLPSQYLYTNGTCLACGPSTGAAVNGTCLTGSSTIVGGRCNGFGTCIGTPVNFCLGTAKVACPTNPSQQSSFCDLPADPALLAAANAYKTAQGYTGSVYGVLLGTYDTANNPFCNLDTDCPIGLWCNAYYKTTTFAGQCQGNC